MTLPRHHLLLLLATAAVLAQENPSAPSRVVETAGIVESRPSPAAPWLPATNGLQLLPGHHVRTGPLSRAAVQFSDRSILRLGERTELEIQAPRQAERRRFGLLRGLLFFLNRERPADIEFETPLTTGAIRGTEFVLESNGTSGATRLALLDGQVDLTATRSTLALRAGEQAVVEPGQPPAKAPLLDAASVVQWALYYPAIVSPADLRLPAGDADALAPALESYRAGDLHGARSRLLEVPPGRPERESFRTAVELAFGSLPGSSRAPASGPGSGVDRALTELIATVRGSPPDPAHAAVPTTATEWLARSYSLQARFQLAQALNAATHATALAPDFGFAQARVAELEWALERRRDALEHLDRALQSSPQLAQAHALRGFILLEQQDPPGALQAFDRAIALDPALGSGWLGRGLAQMQSGQRPAALASFQTAVALEPRRALHRAYLGKAWTVLGESGLAAKELRLAKGLDPADPTAWLYSALELWQRHRPAAAIRELERSTVLNDNRQLFHSRMALDRDQAIRNAQLAALYRDAGLPDWGLQAAASAVAEDYTSASAHRFLANSYQTLEDPNRYNLRYESARQGEFLVAALLAPAGAALLSQQLSPQEYLRFFDPPRIGVGTFTEYRSSGDWRQEATAFGSLNQLSYATDVTYVSRHGEAENDWRERLDLAAHLKQRVSAQDEVYLQLGIARAEMGDVAGHYDPASARARLAVRENQQPGLHVGWHREWSPGNHTLFLFSHLTDSLELRDPDATALFLRQSGGVPAAISTAPFFDLRYESDFRLTSAELQHLWQTDRQTLVLGGRYQDGRIEPHAVLSRALTGTVTDQQFAEPLHRVDAYVYDHWQIFQPLRLTAGLAYAHLEHPLNTENAPITEGRQTQDQVSPKIALLLTPWTHGHLRAAWSRALGGMLFDNSVRLEPSQLAGFPQAYRSLIPESVAGQVPGTTFDTAHVSFDQSFATGTYLGLDAAWLHSDGSRVVGIFTNALVVPIPDTPSGTEQTLNYLERGLGVRVAQLVGDGLHATAGYRLSEARFAGRFPGIPVAVAGLDTLEQDERALLHEASLSVGYQHPAGFFAGWESDWYRQDNDGYAPARPVEDLWQHHLWAGWRFPRNHAELRFGLLNLTDTDYRLNPLNALNAPPRGRTATVSLRLSF